MPSHRQGGVVVVRARVNTPAELGSALREFRARAGLSQRDLAAELGVSQRYVWELERGKPGKVTDRLFALLRLLQVRMTLEQGER
jgi:HTH-type transcriptional regulator/antitoxin HipB